MSDSNPQFNFMLRLSEGDVLYKVQQYGWNLVLVVCLDILTHLEMEKDALQFARITLFSGSTPV